MNQPVFTVIVGANGCGKSTLTQWAKSLFQQSAVLDPDAIAVQLKARFQTGWSDIEAGKEVLRSADTFLERLESFSVETTLSGSTYLKMLARARGLAYKTRLLYIGTEDVGINMARIRARVLKGGHDVPEEDQLRRYPRSFNNLAKAIDLAEECVLFDNSTKAGHRIVGLKLCGTECSTSILFPYGRPSFAHNALLDTGPFPGRAYNPASILIRIKTATDPLARFTRAGTLTSE